MHFLFDFFVDSFGFLYEEGIEVLTWVNLTLKHDSNA